MAHHKVPAVSVAVINDGKLEWAKAYGVIDATTNQPANAETLFQAASIRKPISTLAALRKADAALPTAVQVLNGEDPVNTQKVIVDIEPGSKWRYSGAATQLCKS